MKERLLKNMGYLIVLLDIAIYLILSYVFVSDFQHNILAIIVNSALLFVGAIIANTALTKQGILNGRDSDKYKETLNSHIKQKQKVYPKIKHLQAWLDKDYYKLMKMGRTLFVNSAGLDYDDVFTEEGRVKKDVFIEKPKPIIYKTVWEKTTAWIRRLHRWIFSEEWKIYRQKRDFIRKAKKYKVTRQTISYLINIDEEKDPNNFGITERQYTRSKSSSSAITRLIFSVLLQSISFGFYGFNLETFLIQMLNIVLILISSLFSMYNAYFFMVKTHRETIIKKIDKLEEFDNADLSEFEVKENEIEDEQIYTEEPLSTESNVVQEIYREIDSGKESDLCCDTDSGVRDRGVSTTISEEVVD